VPRADASLPNPLVPERRQETRPAPTVPSGDQVLPLSLMRKTIARRLVESKTQIPHFYLTADADMEAAMAFREQVKEVHGAKLSVNDLIIKAAALALRRMPECNASWTDEGIVRYARVDVGMAVAVEDGLLTPVIRSADVKTLGQIAAEAQDLAKRARDRKLKPEDMTGSTFSISNLGMMGIKEFSAIINPPEAAILAVGATRKEPVVRNDQIVIGQRMSLTLSCDHRVIDGALGARLLTMIISILERPITLAF
jgi:pyruvate dehydrogenase E2 component (dihydrolipoamide acetyltransferase)